MEVLLETVFLLGPCKGAIRGTIGTRTEAVRSEPPFREDLSPEEEE
jgi:hypothetical protein